MDSHQDSSGGADPASGAIRALKAGDSIGRFEIVGPIGAGGMGEVYRARDAQLHRDVAIKVLPAAFTENADRRRRFEREARAAAGLNHPNVLAVHDAGLHEGIPFIVTELLEGETLRARMSGRPLPPRKAVDYAIQIASGLAAGHDRGIIHRDIKPDNVFVTHDGRVKILDFGLARFTDPTGPDDATATLTFGGVPVAAVVGTAAYMSPEQARGLRTDQRSDLFSLGVVLYEMLNGSSPFRRDTPADSISAILHDDPPELACTRQAGPSLERIVRHCLEKNPEERVQNARDLIFNLQNLSFSSSPSAVRAGMRLPRRRLAPLVAVLAIVAAAALGFLLGQGRQSMRGSIATVLTPVQRLTEFTGIEESPALSPDGRQVTFTAAVGGRRQIFVRLLAGGSPVQITRDRLDHQSPRWSANGDTIFYTSPAQVGGSQGTIWSIPALGGSPRRVIDAISDADVSRSDALACFRLQNGRIQLVRTSVSGDDVKVIAELSSGYHLHPRWSPDGRWIAFQEGDGVRNDVYVVPAAGGAVRQLTSERAMIRGLTWRTDSTAVVYATSHGSTVPYLPPLALREAKLDGGGAQITIGDGWYEDPDVHSTGLMAAARVRIAFDIWTFPFGGDPLQNVERAEQITRQTGQVLTPSEAPGGNALVFLSDSGGHANLWVLSRNNGELRQVTFEQDPAVAVGAAVWSPDGRSIAFVSSRGHTGLDFGVWLVNPDGTNLRNVAPRGLGMAWSPDGRWVYFAESSAGRLFKIPAAGGAAVQVRDEPTRNVIGVHDNTLYYTVERPLLDGRPEHEIRAATPEDGPSRALARIPAARVPPWQIVNPSLSPDGEWLAMPLTDGFTTNIWALSTRTGSWRQVTDFRDRATFIVRRVSWSAGGRSILAAVGQGEADIMVLQPFGARPK